MKKLILLMLLVSGVAFGQSTRKIDRLSKKVDVFWFKKDSKPEGIETITVLGDGILISTINFAFASRGVRSLSSNAAENRLLQIRKKVEDGDEIIDILGNKKLVKSDIVLEVSWVHDVLQADAIRKVNIAIVDLSKDGEIIGGAKWKGARFDHVIGEAIAVALLKELNNKQ